MKTLKNTTPRKRIEYTHFLKWKNKKYIREEVIMPQSYSYESSPDKLEDFHTISWRNFDEDEYQKNGNIEYYSNNSGWSKNGKLNKKNPTPEIEKMFKKTLGKDLIYFNN